MLRIRNGKRQSNSRGSNKPNSRWRKRSSYKSRSRSSNRHQSKRKKKTIDRNLFINDLQSEVETDKQAYTGKKFAELGFDDRLFVNIHAKGFETTTEIQEKAIPLIMGGNDVLGISATGSGKTGAFLIPMIQKLITDNSQKLLVVAPTRELAMQISKEAVSFLKGTNSQSALIIGGESMNRQINQLQRGGHIIIGTPGRLVDLVRRGHIKLHQYNNIVVDEVDRMLDMGFIRDIRFIFTKLAQEKQALFFSATLNNTVEKTVASLSKSFEVIRLANNKPNKSVVQSVIDYNHSSEKLSILQEILKKREVEKALVFVDTKRFADKVNKVLHRNNFKVDAIHGDKRQNVRKRIFESFKLSKIHVLVATNVAARGLDVDDITHVINLDEPQTYDEYIHRIGRTGRNGALGTAYTFVQKGR
ncbi:MAG: DEAD/DEAH box helicase [Candidatus Dojkabacteria bacterium]